MSTSTTVAELLDTRLALSYKEFGVLIGLTAGGIRQQCNRGVLSVVRFGGRSLIPISEVHRLKDRIDAVTAARVTSLEAAV